MITEPPVSEFWQCGVHAGCENTPHLGTMASTLARLKELDLGSLSCDLRAGGTAEAGQPLWLLALPLGVQSPISILVHAANPN
jgi:hypothetical protein